MKVIIKQCTPDGLLIRFDYDFIHMTWEDAFKFIIGVVDLDNSISIEARERTASPTFHKMMNELPVKEKT